MESVVLAACAGIFCTVAGLSVIRSHPRTSVGLQVLATALIITAIILHLA